MLRKKCYRDIRSLLRRGVARRITRGSSQMTLKLLFDLESGKLLGAQAVGKKGIDQTMYVLATAIHG